MQLASVCDDPFWGCTRWGRPGRYIQLRTLDGTMWPSEQNQVRGIEQKSPMRKSIPHYPYSQLSYVPRCWIPCDHLPIRSWPLFRARDVMRGVIESFQEACAA